MTFTATVIVELIIIPPLAAAKQKDPAHHIIQLKLFSALVFLNN